MCVIELNTIPEALEDIKNGKIIIVVDDKNRENEGDFLAAAELTTTEIINFMAIYGKGLICSPLPEQRCVQLDLYPMTSKNSDPKETAFTITIDLLGNGVTTGISAVDRAKTIIAMMDDDSKPEDFSRPGHIFPLIAKKGGVLKRAGHTEAAIDLTELAGLKPGGTICEVMSDDGTMARLPELMEIAKKHNLKIISIEDLIEYRLAKGDLVTQIEEKPVKTIYGDFVFHAFQEKYTDQIHFALTKGNWLQDEPVLVRVQSSSIDFDILNRLIHGEKPMLEKITQMINKEGKGAIVFINNVSTLGDTLKKLEQFLDYQNTKTISEHQHMNFKDYGIGTQILKDLGINKFKIISQTHNQKPVIKGYDVEITEIVEL